MTTIEHYMYGGRDGSGRPFARCKCGAHIKSSIEEIVDHMDDFDAPMMNSRIASDVAQERRSRNDRNH